MIITVGIRGVVESEMFGYVNPDGVFIEGVSVGVEAVERRGRRPSRAVGLVIIVVNVHGGVVVVSEGYACAELAAAVRLAALSADGFGLVAFQFALAACQAGKGGKLLA